MYLLYVDDSGSVVDPASGILVLAGFAIFERQTHWLEQQLNAVAARFDPEDHRAVELHGSPMYGGRGFWRSVPREDRHRAMMDSLDLLGKGNQSIRLFGIVIDLERFGEDAIYTAFEHLCHCFDHYLAKMHRALWAII